MKKIFILTGEPSGDKLASKIIAELKGSRSDIEYLSVGGSPVKINIFFIPKSYLKFLLFDNLFYTSNIL
jgi:lipid A disaccharide synthetase